MEDIKESYLKSIDRTLKAILAELQKDKPKSNSNRPVTKEEVMAQAIRGKPPDRKRRSYK